ncbi:hypothetical protein ND972_16520 [Vibrio diabolicus]|uniref:hypothetical protein n=1 Tax=Vibrio diabolicus TaxID=50719 RepID=UPI00215F59E4|nr:hypothetical protein [Vibrio diabolicus]MCS0398386.1 hypothetical protein [Vibrio diabolicus]
MTQSQAQTNKKTANTQNITVGGVSAVFIGIANLVFLGKPEIQGIITTAVPIAVSGFFKFATYSFIYCGMDDIESLKSRTKLEKKIKFYEKRLKEAKESDRDPKDIAELSQCLLDAEKAMGNLPN